MKPWEETWTLSISENNYPRAFVRFSADGGDLSELWMSDARATLAAAAPDLYRALVMVMWQSRRCPCCDAELRTAKGAATSDPHAGHCALSAALRKARGET